MKTRQYALIFPPT